MQTVDNPRPIGPPPTIAGVVKRLRVAEAQVASDVPVQDEVILPATQAYSMPAKSHRVALTDLPVELLYDLAEGVVDWAVVFARYHLSEEQAAYLQAHPTLLGEVKALRDSMGKPGSMLRRYLADELKVRVLPALLADAASPNTDPKTRLAIAQWVTNMSGQQPEAEKNAVAAGGGASITIILPPQQAVGQVYEVNRGG